MATTSLASSCSPSLRRVWFCSHADRDDGRDSKHRDRVELDLHQQLTDNQDESVASQVAHEIEFRHALDTMLDDVDVGRPMRDDSGEIVDFVIEFVNSHGSTGARRGTDGLVGQLLCEVHPDWRESGMFDKFRDVVDDRDPVPGPPRAVRRSGVCAKTGIEGKRRQAYWTVQVAKFGDGYISASRDITEVVLAEEATRAVALQAAAEKTAIALLQAAALPRTLPQLPGVRIAAVYEPMDPSQPVGGDWYDVFALDDTHVALVIADVAGHGHSAAIFMVQVRNVFRAIAAEHTEPADVLMRANNVTTRLNEPDGPFVTCCFAVLDISGRTLRWAQAGHFSPLLVMADGTSDVSRRAAGCTPRILRGQHYESSSIEVRPGDRIVMFTDGMVERRREHLDIGLARLSDLAASHANALHAGLRRRRLQRRSPTASTTLHWSVSISSGESIIAARVLASGDESSSQQSAGRVMATSVADRRRADILLLDQIRPVTRPAPRPGAPSSAAAS